MPTRIGTTSARCPIDFSALNAGCNRRSRSPQPPLFGTYRVRWANARIAESVQNRFATRVSDHADGNRTDTYAHVNSSRRTLRRTLPRSRNGSSERLGNSAYGLLPEGARAKSPFGNSCAKPRDTAAPRAIASSKGCFGIRNAAGPVQHVVPSTLLDEIRSELVPTARTRVSGAYQRRPDASLRRKSHPLPHSLSELGAVAG